MRKKNSAILEAVHDTDEGLHKAGVMDQITLREYDEFLRSKVEAGRASMQVGRGLSNDEVEAKFAAKRAQVASQA